MEAEFKCHKTTFQKLTYQNKVTYVNLITLYTVTVKYNSLIYIFAESAIYF